MQPIHSNFLQDKTKNGQAFVKNTSPRTDFEKFKDKLSSRNLILLNSIFNHMSDDLTIIDKNLDIIFSNSNISYPIFAERKAKLCKKLCFDKIEPCEICPIKNVFNLKKEIVFEKSTSKSDKYFEITAFPIFENKKVKYVAVLTRDISKKKIDETIIKKNDERFKSFFDNILIGFYRVSPEGKLLMANKSLTKMLGFDTVEEYNNINNSKSGYLHKIYKNLFFINANKNGKIEGYETAWKRKNGDVIFIRENANTVKDKTGKILYYEGTMEDITVNKKAELKLIKDKKRSEDDERRKNAYLSRFSEDVKKPIEKIISVSELRAGNKLSPDKCKLYADIINNSSKDLLDFVANIQLLPELKTDKPTISKERFSVNRVVTAVYSNFKDVASNDKDIMIIGKKNLSDDQSYIFSDKDVIKKIFTNIIRNSLKYIEQGDIEFGYRLDKDFFEFYVTSSYLYSYNENSYHQDLKLIVAKGLTELIGGVFKIERTEKETMFTFSVSCNTTNF